MKLSPSVEIVSVRAPLIFNSRGVDECDRNGIVVPAVHIVRTFKLEFDCDLHIVRRIVKDLEHRFDGVAFIYLIG